MQGQIRGVNREQGHVVSLPYFVGVQTIGVSVSSIRILPMEQVWAGRGMWRLERPGATTQSSGEAQSEADDQQTLVSAVPAPLGASEIVEQLQRLQPNEVVYVTHARPGQLDHWPDRSTDGIVITGRSRVHYHERHANEVNDIKSVVVATLLDPDIIYADGRDGREYQGLFVR